MLYRTLSLFAIMCFIYLTIDAQPAREDIKRSRELFNEGVRLGIDEEFEKALKAFDKAIEINSVYAKAFLYRGLAKTELSDYKEAIKDYTITIELDPGYSDQAHYFRGITKYKKGNYVGSGEDLTISVRLNPDFAAFFHRGKTYLKLEEYGRALQDFEISNKLNTDYKKTYLYRGISLYYIGEYQSAIDDLNIATQSMPYEPKGFYYMGLARTANQNSYAAIEALDKCIDLNPKFYEAYEARATARKNTGNNKAAQDDLEKAKTIMAEIDTKDKTMYTKKTRETTVDKKTTAKDLDIAGYFKSDKSDEKTEQATALYDQKDINKDKTTPEVVEKSDKHIESEPDHDLTQHDITQLSSGIYDKMLNKSEPKGFGIQVASYTNTDNLKNLANAYEKQFGKPVYININTINGQKIYRIIIGKFDDRANAEDFRDNLRQNHFSDSFLISFERIY